MDPLLLAALASAVVAGVLTSVLVPPVVKLSRALRVLDHPDEPRKVQATAVPRLGGAAIGVGLAGASLLGLLAGWREWGATLPRADLVALPVATALVFLVGLVDDLFGVTPGKKFVVQILAAWLLVRVGWTLQVLKLPLIGEVDLGMWGGLVAILWIVGVTNALNLIDGLDGLAGGVAAIIAASLLFYSLVQNNRGSVVLMAAIFGACVGFLRHNWEPAKVFMGDSGSLTLGFLLGAISLHSSFKATAAVAILVPILALGLPVIDTLLVMAVRFFEGEGSPLKSRVGRMFRGDRQHLHHLLSNLTVHHRKVVVAIYAVVALFCVMAIAVALTGFDTLGIVFVAVQIGAVVVMRRLGLARQAKRLAQERVGTLRTGLPGWLRRGAPATPASPGPPDAAPPSAPAARKGAPLETR